MPWPSGHRARQARFASATAGWLWGSLLVSGCGQSTRAAVRSPASLATASSIRFEQVSPTAGIRHQWRAQRHPLNILGAFGCGCAFLDYDNDGLQDILLVDKPAALLYRNLGKGSFQEVSASTGLGQYRGDWKGCGVGDYDGDGFLDLILTGYRCLALLKNLEGREWRAVTLGAGLDTRNRGHWGSGAGFMDLDRDGDLDLVLLNYVKFGPQERQYCDLPRGARGGCPPRTYLPEYPELWENLGGGRLRDVTNTSGMKDTTGTAQVLAFADVDEDERDDIFIGNDGTPSDLMRNLGGLHFENTGVPSGVAYGLENNAIAAMGADWADYDRDGRLDLVITAFADEPYSLLHNIGAGRFEHVGSTTGLAEATRRPLGFGSNFLDMDNDGWPDLAIANGHVQSEAARANPLDSFRQPIMLFHNQQGRAFRDAGPGQPREVADPILGRGSASGDFDNDGRMDWLAVDYEGIPLLLHNITTTPNHWLKLDLRGSGSNRFAYGARLVARAGSRIWAAQVSPACSYLSSSDPRAHLGLGAVTKLENLTIYWPSGRVETLRNLEVDRILTLREGASPEATVAGHG